MLWGILKWVSTLAVLVWVFYRVDFGQLKEQLWRLSGWTFASAVTIGLFNFWVASLRWNILIQALTHGEAPRLWSLFKKNLVGHFWNTFLPGGVGGDIVRGASVGDNKNKGATKAISLQLQVVFFERVLGLTALFFLVCVSSACGIFQGLRVPLAVLGDVFAFLNSWWSDVFVAVFFAGAAGTCGGLVLVTLWAKKLQGDVKKIVSAFFLSILVQLIVVLWGQLILSEMLGTGWPHALIFLPIVFATAFFPLSVGGLGVREAMLVLLFGMLHVESVRVLAAGAAITSVLWCLALIGGIMALFCGNK